MTAQRLLLDAVAVEPRNDHLLTSLALTLSDFDQVQVNGQAMSKKQLFVTAINCNLYNVDCWCLLALELDPDETVALSDDIEMSREELCLSAVELRPESAVPLVILGLVMTQNTVTLLDGRNLTKQDVFIAAADRAPHVAPQIYRLLEFSMSGDTVTLGDGRVLTKADVCKLARLADAS